MTDETHNEMVNESIAMMEEHNRQQETLLVKFFGEGQLAFGRAMTDLFFKKQWYANRIKDLGVWEGHNSMRQRRTRSHTSPLFQKYQTIETQLRLAAETLIREMVMLGHNPEPYPENSWVLAIPFTDRTEVAYVYKTKAEAEEHGKQSNGNIVCSLKEAKKRGYAKTEPIRVVQL